MRRTALVLLLLVAGCGGTASYAGPDGGPKVYVVGDSLLVEAWDEVRAALPADRLAAHRERGKGTPWALDRLRRQVDRDPPDVAVVAIGTNDWPDGISGEERDAYAGVVRTLGRVRCAVWVVPAERFADVTAEILAAVEGSSVHVARWDEHAAGHPEWYVGDGVHHTEEGSAAYARFVADARRASCS